MTVALTTPTTLQYPVSPWGTFEAVRDHLFDQWLDIPFLPETGLPVDVLHDEVRTYFREHADLPTACSCARTRIASS